MHGFPIAANAEYWPCGSVSSKLPIGSSGTVLNVLLVTALFADVRFPVQVERHAVTLEHDDQFGELYSAVKTKYAGPVNGAGTTA